MAPQLYDGRLLISTIPGNGVPFYLAGAYGVLYSLDARTGQELWSFSTVQGGSKLWGDPQVNSGGGLWYPPAVDSHGRVFIGTGNPGPYPLTPSDPNARSRPGPNLYTDSLVALDGTTGKLLWYRQITPHDIRDHDFQDSPILVTLRVPRPSDRGRDRRGQVGLRHRVPRLRRNQLWKLSIGKHNRYQSGPLPARPVLYCPGSLGGVLTPMAEARGLLYVPWIDLCFKGSATGLVGAGKTSSGLWPPSTRTTGAIRWKHTFGASIPARPRLPTTSSSPRPTTARSTRSQPKPAPCSGTRGAVRHQLVPGRDEDDADRRHRRADRGKGPAERRDRRLLPTPLSDPARPRPGERTPSRRPGRRLP